MKKPAEMVSEKSHEAAFAEVVKLIESSRHRSYQVVNTVLIDLYWKVGKYISHKLETSEWGDGVVVQLALYPALPFTHKSMVPMKFDQMPLSQKANIE